MVAFRPRVGARKRVARTDGRRWESDASAGTHRAGEQVLHAAGITL